MRYLAANYLFNKIHEHVCLQVLKGLWFFGFTHEVSLIKKKEKCGL